jgi:hypothetical protein
MRNAELDKVWQSVQWQIITFSRIDLGLIGDVAAPHDFLA